MLTKAGHFKKWKKQVENKAEELGIKTTTNPNPNTLDKTILDIYIRLLLKLEKTI